MLLWFFNYAFVACPHGSALDGTRPWEALLAGCIPIVKRSPVDYLYEELPIALVDTWDEIRPENLRRWLDRFADVDRAFVEARLSMEYWLAEIGRASALARATTLVGVK